MAPKMVLNRGEIDPCAFLLRFLGGCRILWKVRRCKMLKSNYANGPELGESTQFRMLMWIVIVNSRCRQAAQCFREFCDPILGCNFESERVPLRVSDQLVNICLQHEIRLNCLENSLELINKLHDSARF